MAVNETQRSQLLYKLIILLTLLSFSFLLILGEKETSVRSVSWHWFMANLTFRQLYPWGKDFTVCIGQEA